MLPLWLLFLISTVNSYSQSAYHYFNTAFVCFLDLDYDSIDNDYPLRSQRVIYPCFVKDTIGWRIFNNEDYAAAALQKRYRTYYKGEAFRSVWVTYRYDTLEKKVLETDQQRIPAAGSATDQWHRFRNIPSYAPLILLNRIPRRQLYKLTPQQPGKIIYRWIEQFLREKAGRMHLSHLLGQAVPLIDTVKNVWQINDDVYMVAADVNLQMCRFSDSDSLNNIPAHHCTIERCGDINATTDDPWRTTNCCFIKAGSKWMYAGRNLELMGMMDADNDGTLELLLRRQAHGFISYIMICNDYDTMLEKKVIEWW